MKNVMMGLALVFGSAGLIGAQEPATSAGTTVVRLDPALDAVISVKAKLDALKEDFFGFNEGAVWIKNQGGYLIFSDMAANKIYKWTPGAGFTVFVDRSGYSSKDAPAGTVLSNGRLHVSIIGSNGIAVDGQGRLIVCTHGDRNLYRLEKDGTRTTLADRFDGHRLNGPNDVVVKSDGSIYFSDLGAGTRPEQRDLEFNAFFRWKDGKLDLVDKVQGANGLAFSPDEKILYGVAMGKVFRYDVMADGTLSNRQLFLDPSATDKSPGIPDGMKVDRRGNVFVTGPSGVWIIAPTGKVLGKIRLPELATNVAFGDNDAKGLYITGWRGIYHIRLNRPAQ